MSKTPKEFVKDKLNEKTGQGITLYEHYLAHDTTVSIGTAVSWMEEYASLSQPIGKTYTKEEMIEYALKAWMAGENNGRKFLIPEGKLDKRGSKIDFKDKFLRHNKL
jgi:ferritin